MPLKQGKVQRLGQNWKGIEGEFAAKFSNLPPYLNSYYTDLPLAHISREDAFWLRSNPAGGKIITDGFGINQPDWPSFQTMQLRFNLDNQADYWPAVFEENLHGIPTPQLLNLILKDPYHPDNPYGTESLRPRPAIPVKLPQPKAGVDYMHFRGRGRDDDIFWCSGMLHALPSQNGVIGWQRITFMKHFDRNGEIRTTTFVPNNPNWQPTSDLITADIDVDGNQVNTNTATPSVTHTIPKYPNDIDRKSWRVPHDCWAFEGVVLPGGKIIVGKSTQIPYTSFQDRHIYLTPP